MDVNKILCMAKQSTKNGDIDEAKRLYFMVLDKFPASKVAKKELKKIGQTDNRNITKEQENYLIKLYSNRELKKAITEALKLSELYPDNALIYNILGVSYQDLGQFQEAISFYKQAIKTNPNYINTYYNLGNALNSSGEKTEAITYYQQAIKINPNYADAHNNLGNVLKDIGEIMEAMTSYQQAIKINPNCINAYNNLGNILYNIGKKMEAITSYQQAIKINPNYADAYNNLGNVLKDIGKITEAMTSHQQAIKINSNNPDYIVNLMQLLIQLNIANNIEQLNEVQNNILYKIYLLIYTFMNQSFIKAKFLIDEIKTIMKEDVSLLVNNKNNKFIVGYLDFISKLNAIALERKDKSLVNTENNIIYHIGESHCLSFAHQEIYLKNQNYTIKPLIIFGAKAWHLHSDKTNQYKAFFENHINGLKKGSKIMLSFGEIDCRLDEGIMHHYLKTNSDLNVIVYKTVKDYIDYTENILNGLEIKRLYMGIPAPVIEEFKYSQDSHIALRINIIKLFNESFIKIARERELNLVDVYQLTANKEGTSNLKYMCDNFHLDPSSLKYLELNW